MGDSDGRDYFGLLPAAGHARRLGELACSKELLPVMTPAGPRPVIDQALDQFAAAGIRRACVVLRPGKWDIPQHLAQRGLPELAYVLRRLPYGVPYTLDSAYAFCMGQPVALAFPDIVYGENPIFPPLITVQRERDADVVLGLFPADRPDQCDLVDCTPGGVVRALQVKQAGCALNLTWGVAVWSGRFSTFLHEFVAGWPAARAQQEELHLGHVVQQALLQNLRIYGVRVSAQSYIDIGTPEGYRRACGD